MEGLDARHNWICQASVCGDNRPIGVNKELSSTANLPYDTVAQSGVEYTNELQPMEQKMITKRRGISSPNLQL
jgi:hypothetical protein